ncbi:hypothetical protein CRE_25896 [Caenorhabditis remanei]|uniref:DMAP1-binding domain-containing protein n=1 Tax=Caenorhabditis remanei TaxID=31234 RepID=E3NGD6_CAERE|nr:hypothetical protein CRE_25896 [Caenorhabditis remanei]
MPLLTFIECPSLEMRQLLSCSSTIHDSFCALFVLILCSLRNPFFAEITEQKMNEPDPTLPDEIREKLAELELELSEGDITKKGYDKKRDALLAPFKTAQNTVIEIRVEAVHQALAEYSDGRKLGQQPVKPHRRNGTSVSRSNTQKSKRSIFNGGGGGGRMMSADPNMQMASGCETSWLRNVVVAKCRSCELSRSHIFNCEKYLVLFFCTFSPRISRKSLAE